MDELKPPNPPIKTPKSFVSLSDLYPEAILGGLLRIGEHGPYMGSVEIVFVFSNSLSTRALYGYCGRNG